MTPDHETKAEKPDEAESEKLTTEGLENIVGGATMTTQPRLSQTSPAPNLIAKVGIIPCI